MAALLGEVLEQDVKVAAPLVGAVEGVVLTEPVLHALVEAVIEVDRVPDSEPVSEGLADEEAEGSLLTVELAQDVKVAVGAVEGVVLTEPVLHALVEGEGAADRVTDSEPVSEGVGEEEGEGSLLTVELAQDVKVAAPLVGAVDGVVVTVPVLHALEDAVKAVDRVPDSEPVSEGVGEEEGEGSLLTVELEHDVKVAAPLVGAVDGVKVAETVLQTLGEGERVVDRVPVNEPVSEGVGEEEGEGSLLTVELEQDVKVAAPLVGAVDGVKVAETVPHSLAEAERVVDRVPVSDTVSEVVGEEEREGALLTVELEQAVMVAAALVAAGDGVGVSEVLLHTLSVAAGELDRVPVREPVRLVDRLRVGEMEAQAVVVAVGERVATLEVARGLGLSVPLVESVAGAEVAQGEGLPEGLPVTLPLLHWLLEWVPLGEERGEGEGGSVPVVQAVAHMEMLGEGVEVAAAVVAMGELLLLPVAEGHREAAGEAEAAGVPLGLWGAEGLGLPSGLRVPAAQGVACAEGVGGAEGLVLARGVALGVAGAEVARAVLLLLAQPEGVACWVEAMGVGVPVLHREAEGVPVLHWLGLGLPVPTAVAVAALEPRPLAAAVGVAWGVALALLLREGVGAGVEEGHRLEEAEAVRPVEGVLRALEEGEAAALEEGVVERE